jgi:hypothetical protein
VIRATSKFTLRICILVIFIIPLFSTTAQFLPSCSTSYGETVERDLYGEGTLDCQFQGGAGDNVTVNCGLCDGMLLMSENGERIQDTISGPGILYILPETGTYILTVHYVFVDGYGESRCVSEQPYYDSEGNYMYSMCTEYEMEQHQENTYQTLSFTIELESGNGPGTTTGSSAADDESPQATSIPAIPLRSEPITIPVDELCPSGTAQVQIRLRINALEIVDADEADGSSIVGGDEAYLYYGIGVDDGTEYWNLGENNEFLPVWSGDAAEHDVFTTFDPVERVVDCGSLTVIIIAADEDDGFLGSTSLGVEQVQMSLEEGESIELEPETEVIFSGTSTDGTYDYRVRYTVELTAAETIDAATFGQ